MLPVRVFYKKLGVAAYISHLDLQRAVNRAICRSGLSPVYSEGFNPHIKMTFALPLPLFVESECEAFDFAIHDDISYDEITQRLKAVFPPDLEVTATAAPQSKLSATTFSDYEINFYSDLSADQILALLDGEMIIEKKSKKGIIKTDISPLIVKKQASGSPDITLKLTLHASNEKYLNPMNIVKFLAPYIQAPIIRRTAVYYT